MFSAYPMGYEPYTSRWASRMYLNEDAKKAFEFMTITTSNSLSYLVI
jgi:hypothetical protein